MVPYNTIVEVRNFSLPLGLVSSKVLSLAHLVSCFLASAVSCARSSQSLSRRTDHISILSRLAQVVSADTLISWRLYIIWSRRRRVLILPAMFICTEAGKSPKLSTAMPTTNTSSISYGPLSVCNGLDEAAIHAVAPCGRDHIKLLYYLLEPLRHADGGRPALVRR